VALLHMAGLENSECIWKIQRKPEVAVSVSMTEIFTKPRSLDYSCPIRLRGAWLQWLVCLNVTVEERNISGVQRYNWVSERITNKRKILRRSGEGEKGRCLPWIKEEEGAYIFWMKQVPVLFGLSKLEFKFQTPLHSSYRILKRSRHFCDYTCIIFFNVK
jgi:hypothetical protein